MAIKIVHYAFWFFFGGLLMAWVSLAYAMDFQNVSAPQSGVVTISATGEIFLGDDKKFDSIVSGHEKEHVNVFFKSLGGNAFAGMLIGRTIRKNDFVAAVLRGDECYSACALAWLGSRHRVMQRGAIVGFHGAYKIDYGQSVITAPGNAVIGAYLAELGFSVNAIIFMTEASPGKVAYLDPLSAERYSIEVAVISSDYKSTELYGQRRVAAAQPEAVTPAQPAIDANVAAREAAELPNIANACHTVVDPRTYDYSNCYRQETESLHWAVTSQEAYPKEKRHSCWKESKSYPIMRWKHYKLCVAGK